MENFKFEDSLLIDGQLYINKNEIVSMFLTLASEAYKEQPTNTKVAMLCNYFAHCFNNMNMEENNVNN